MDVMRRAAEFPSLLDEDGGADDAIKIVCFSHTQMATLPPSPAGSAALTGGGGGGGGCGKRLISSAQTHQ